MKEFRYDVLTLHIVVIILSARGEIQMYASVNNAQDVSKINKNLQNGKV